MAIIRLKVYCVYSVKWKQQSISLCQLVSRTYKGFHDYGYRFRAILHVGFDKRQIWTLSATFRTLVGDMRKKDSPIHLVVRGTRNN